MEHATLTRLSKSTAAIIWWKRALVKLTGFVGAAHWKAGRYRTGTIDREKKANNWRRLIWRPAPLLLSPPQPDKLSTANLNWHHHHSKKTIAFLTNDYNLSRHYQSHRFDLNFIRGKIQIKNKKVNNNGINGSALNTSFIFHPYN